MLFTITGSGAHISLSAATSGNTAISLPPGTNALRITNFSNENAYVKTGVGSAPTPALYEDFYVKTQTTEVVGIDPATTHVAVLMGSAVNATIAITPGRVC